MNSEHKRLLGTALSMHQVGNIKQAIELYHQALSIDPNHTDTLLYIAVAYCQNNEYKTAKEFFDKIALEDVATNPNYFINYGLTLSELGEFEKAIELLKKGTELDPEATEAYFNLGRCYYRMQIYTKATGAFAEVLNFTPNDIQALSYLGAISIELNELEQGLSILERAFNLGGESSFIRYSTGSAFEKQGHIQEAEKQYQRAISLDNNNISAHLGLCRTYAKQGEYIKASEEVENTRLLSNGRVEDILECSLSTIAHFQNDNKAAEFHAKKALEITPESKEAYGLLALACSNTNRQLEAVEYFNKATNTDKPNLMHLINMSKNYTAIGMPEEAIATAQKAFELDINSSDAFSSLLFYMHYPSSISSKAITSLHKQFGDIFSNKTPTQEDQSQETKNKKPKIGFISGDFCVHSIQFFFEPLLIEISQASEIETILFSNTPKKDQLTKRYINYADKFIDIRHLSNNEAYEIIRSENIDIMIDLSGHTNNNRLKLLAMKPAKIQMTYLGYPNTTGLKEIDYRLTDFTADPEDKDDQYSEKLLRLDGCFLTYLPPKHPEAEETSRDHIVFGSFNNIAKLSDETLISWSEILKKVENSILQIKSNGLNETDLDTILTPKFETLGISRDQIKYSSRQSDFSKHLNLYNDIDIALDTFPYNGTTTSFEALLMGRPIITRFSDTHVSSVGKSILTALNEVELISDSREDYIKKAVALASNTKKLKEYHRVLPDKLLKSELCNNKLFYKKFIEALIKIQII